MQWVFGAMAVLALIIAFIDAMANWIRHDELEHRVNVIDEVVTVHSEEIDELQRTTAGAKRLQELEEMGNKIVIKTKKGTYDVY